MVVNITNIFCKMKNKRLLSIEKSIIEGKQGFGRITIKHFNLENLVSFLK